MCFGWLRTIGIQTELFGLFCFLLFDLTNKLYLTQWDNKFVEEYLTVFLSFPSLFFRREEMNARMARGYFHDKTVNFLGKIRKLQGSFIIKFFFGKMGRKTTLGRCFLLHIHFEIAIRSIVISKVWLKRNMRIESKLFSPLKYLRLSADFFAIRRQCVKLCTDSSKTFRLSKLLTNPLKSSTDSIKV